MLPSPLRSALNPLCAILILLAKAVASECPKLPSTGQAGTQTEPSGSGFLRQRLDRAYSHGEVAQEPSDFEEDGGLLEVIRSSRSHPSEGKDLSDMSEDEREQLEDCLDSTEKPYPQPKRPVTLTQSFGKMHSLRKANVRAGPPSRPEGGQLPRAIKSLHTLVGLRQHDSAGQ
ncbi:unnamed protein product [Symbiodinium sp. CCMP2592]|nr:unnamed protein product [Symbiodinium sp. CCMP2592]